MQDYLLELSQNPQLKKIFGTIGLPTPQALKRGKGAWADQPLKDRNVVVGGAGNLHLAIGESLMPAGANFYVTGEGIEAYKGPGEAYSRPAKDLAADDVGPKASAYIYDASNVGTAADLAGLYEFAHLRIKSLATCGRFIVLGRPPKDQQTAGAAAASHALEGFARSLAKELGKKGGTAHVVYVAEGAEERLPGLLRFLASERSAYISGQPFTLTKRVKAPASVSFVKPLEGKVALVTGAARGIGEATAKRLAEEGAHVVCLDRPEDDGPLSKVAHEIGGSAFLQDVFAEGAAEAIAKYFTERHGGLDILVNNAGITRDKTLAKMDRRLWDQTLGINLAAVIEVTERLLNGVLRNEGRIVGLSSIAGIAGNFGQTNYSASKSGIIGLVEHLAPALARKGITINAVAPGLIETRLTAAMPFLNLEVARRVANLSQGGLPVDVAETITFLSTPGSFGLTGSVLRVCGGNMVGA